MSKNTKKNTFFADFRWYLDSAKYCRRHLKFVLQLFYDVNCNIKVSLSDIYEYKATIPNFQKNRFFEFFYIFKLI